MILDLLDFTTTRLGRGLPVSPRSMDVGELCREIIDEFQAAHPSRPLRLSCEGDMQIECDRERLRQAISNLIGNAIQHGAENTPIDVSVRCEPAVQTERHMNGGTVVIAVHNEGNPIASEALATIFDPLVRAPHARETRRPGSVGLGLYIAAQIARAHGGDSRVTSTEKAGTTFILHLPRRCKKRA